MRLRELQWRDVGTGDAAVHQERGRRDERRVVARWLEETLAAWRRDEGIDFIVTFFHECAFSTCNGNSSDGGVRSKLASLFSRYQVDMAVQGHNHVYERTNPLISTRR